MKISLDSEEEWQQKACTPQWKGCMGNAPPAAQSWSPAKPSPDRGGRGFEVAKDEEAGQNLLLQQGEAGCCLSKGHCFTQTPLQPRRQSCVATVPITIVQQNPAILFPAHTSQMILSDGNPGLQAMEQPGARPSVEKQCCLQEEWGWGQPVAKMNNNKWSQTSKTAREKERGHKHSWWSNSIATKEGAKGTSANL
ncbi:hypothetical protein DV515_00002439, partial [Chloebia gouldiae]